MVRPSAEAFASTSAVLAAYAARQPSDLLSRARARVCERFLVSNAICSDCGAVYPTKDYGLRPLCDGCTAAVASSLADIAAGRDFALACVALRDLAGKPRPTTGLSDCVATMIRAHEHFACLADNDFTVVLTRLDVRSREALRRESDCALKRELLAKLASLVERLARHAPAARCARVSLLRMTLQDLSAETAGAD